VPDEFQTLRIRLKVAVIDVATGSWSEFAPADFGDEALSAAFNRASSDQDQVALLKAKAYRAAAAEFVQSYVR
jgi:hypothetical protein